MAFSYVEHVGDGVQTAFSFRFTGDGYGYFRESDIHVFVGAVEDKSWTLTAPNQLSFAAAPALGARIVIRRIMPKDLPFSIWKRGNDFSPLTTNNNFLQQLYALQELYDGFMTDGFRFNQNLSMGGYRITDLADGIDPKDAVNVSQLMEANVGAGDAADRAKASADAAKVSEDNAKASELTALDAANRAEIAEVGAAASAQIATLASQQTEGLRDDALAAADRAEKALAAVIPLEQSAASSAASASASKDEATAQAVLATNEANRAKSEADRAKATADSVDMAAINSRLDGVDAKNTEQDGHISTLNDVTVDHATRLGVVEGDYVSSTKDQTIRGAKTFAREVAFLGTGDGYIGGSLKLHNHNNTGVVNIRAGGDNGMQIFLPLHTNAVGVHIPFDKCLAQASSELLTHNRFTFVF